MDDITERLRNGAALIVIRHNETGASDLLVEAADEIIRLRTRITRLDESNAALRRIEAQLQGEVNDMEGRIAELEGEIEALTATGGRDGWEWLPSDLRTHLGDFEEACRRVVADCHDAEGALYWQRQLRTIEAIKAGLAAAQPAQERCWCETCRPVTLTDMRMVLCPDCGNKRCPRATSHMNACTGSNKPGQPGSAYADQPTPSQGEDA